MTTVIGLKSGKEFIVSEESFTLFNDLTHAETKIFISADGKRFIIVPPEVGSIEFYDEPLTEKRLSQLRESATMAALNLSNPVNEVDVNVG